MNNTPNPYQSSQDTLEEDSDVVQRGRTIVLCIIAFTISVSLFVVLMSALRVGFDKLPTQIVRILLTLLIARALYNGRRWARYLFALLYGLGGAAALFSIPALIETAPPYAIAIMIAMGVGYGVSALTLIASPSVGRFLDYQWRQRNPRN